jgi:hypothetical protein
MSDPITAAAKAASPVMLTADYKVRLDALNAAVLSMSGNPARFDPQNVIGRARRFEAYLRGDEA